MSQFLETLGRGLLGRLFDAFEKQLPGAVDDDLDQLLELARGASTSADLALRLGTAYLRESRLTDARSAFERARTLGAPAGVAARGLACVMDDLGRYDEAIRLLDEAAVADADDPAIAFGLGMLHERQGRAEVARGYYESSLKRCPRLRNAHERLAALAAREQDWSSAAAHYRSLSELAPEDLDVLLTLATLRLQGNDAPAAIDSFQRVLLIEPDTCDAASDAALHGGGELNESMVALEKLIQRYPGVSEFRVSLADLCVKASDDRGAVQHYRAAIEINPNYLEATIKLGTQHLRRSRFGAAARQFNRAIELNDRLLSAFIGLGVAQHASGATQDALTTFDLAANLAPNSLLLYNETNRLRLKAEHAGELSGPDATREDEIVEEALRRHERAVGANPTWADAHYRFGLMLRHGGRVHDAIRAFRAAIALSPAFARAHEKLGICLHEIGAYDESRAAFIESLSAPPETLEMHYQLALLYAQQSQFEVSVDCFISALDGAFKEDDVQHTLHLALQGLGLVDRSTANWQSICEMSPLPPCVERRLAPISAIQDEGDT